MRFTEAAYENIGEGLFTGTEVTQKTAASRQLTDTLTNYRQLNRLETGLSLLDNSSGGLCLFQAVMLT